MAQELIVVGSLEDFSRRVTFFVDLEGHQLAADVTLETVTFAANKVTITGTVRIKTLNIEGRNVRVDYIPSTRRGGLTLLDD